MLRVLKEYSIPYTGLKVGKHDFKFEVGNKFFEAFEYSEVESGDLTVDVLLEKQSTLIILYFTISGSVNVPCDRCTELFNQEVSIEERLIVKFGDKTYEETEEILVLSPAEHKIHFAHYIYEFINVAIPSKRIHEEGECNQEIIEKLDTLSTDDDDDGFSDPRWNALKGLDLDE